MKANKAAAVAGATALLLSVTACSGSSTSSKSSSGSSSSGSTSSAPGSSSSTPSAGKGTLIFGEGSDFPTNLLGLIAAGNVTSVADLAGRVEDGLYRFAPNITWQADPDQGTATSTMVDGQQVVDIKINPKAVWADGQPITAADYIFTYNDTKSQDPKKGGCASLLGVTGENQIQKATQVSTKEVKFTFIKGQPFADWQGLFSGASGSSPLLSKHLMDKGSAVANCAAITKGYPIASGMPLGATNGPWQILGKDINVASKTVTLTPNTKYWGTMPKLQRIVYTNIGSDPDTNVKALNNGEVSMIYPQPQLDLVANLAKVTNATTTVNFGPSFEHLDFNTRDPLLGIKAVRQAIAYGLNRKQLVAATVAKFSPKASVLGNRFLVTSQPGYVDHSGAYATTNVAKAKQLLVSAGAKMGSNGIYAIKGKELKFAITTTKGNPLRDTTIQVMKQQLQAIGVSVSEKATDDIFADKTKPDSLEAGGFQLALFAWVAGPAISSSNSIYGSLAFQGGSQGQNYSHGADKGVDAALYQLARAASPAAEIADANKADSLLWGDMFTLPLYQKPTILAYSKKFTGIADNSTQAGPLWNNDIFGLK
jgi:glutathione transport system substrate-binding protein